MDLYLNDFKATGGFLCPDGLNDFVLFLEKKGYIVLHSADEPGVIVISTGSR